MAKTEYITVSYRRKSPASKLSPVVKSELKFGCQWKWAAITVCGVLVYLFLDNSVINYLFTTSWSNGDLLSVDSGSHYL